MPASPPQGYQDLDGVSSLAAGGTIGAGAIASGALLFDTVALPSAHATRAKLFAISDSLGIVPGSGGDGGLWVYDPDNTAKIAKLWQDNDTFYYQSIVQDMQVRFRAADGTTIVYLRGEDFDDSTASQSGSKCVISPIGQHSRVALHNSAAAPTPRANHADLFSMDAVAGATELFAQNEAGVSRQITALEKRLASAVTNVTTTMANLTELTVNLIAGRKYTGRMVLYVNQAAAADGLKVDFDGGTATMTSVYTAITAAMGATVSVRTATALATDLTATDLADTSDVAVEFAFSCVVNAAGTLIPRQCKEADAAGGTMTVRVGSYIHLVDSV